MKRAITRSWQTGFTTILLVFSATAAADGGEILEFARALPAPARRYRA